MVILEKKYSKIKLTTKNRNSLSLLKLSSTHIYYNKENFKNSSKPTHESLQKIIHTPDHVQFPCKIHKILSYSELQERYIFWFPESQQIQHQ